MYFNKRIRLYRSLSKKSYRIWTSYATIHVVYVDKHYLNKVNEAEVINKTIDAQLYHQLCYYNDSKSQTTKMNMKDSYINGNEQYYT